MLKNEKNLYNYLQNLYFCDTIIMYNYILTEICDEELYGSGFSA